MTFPRYPVACLILLLAACQTAPRHNPSLKEARQAYASASLHPRAEQAAANEMAQAKQALDRAERAWQDRGNEDETRHLAYLAYRRAQAAQLLAERSSQEESLKSAGADRERLRANMSQMDAASARQQAAQADQRAASLAQALERLKAQQTDRGLVVTLGDVLFSTDEARLQPGALRTAQELANVLRQHPHHRIRIEGFADDRGSEAHNLRLSTRRAEALKDALVSLGVAADRIEAVGLGEAYPVASNRTESGRQQNRRVEVLFSDDAGQLKSRS